MALKDKFKEKWTGLNKQLKMGVIALVAGAVAVPALLNLGGSSSVDDPSLEAPMDHQSAEPAATPPTSRPADAPKQKLHAAPIKKNAPAAKTKAKSQKATAKGKKKSGKAVSKGKSPKKPTAKLKKASGKKHKMVAKAGKKKKKTGAKARAGH